MIPIDFDYAVAPALLTVVALLVIWRAVRRVSELRNKRYGTLRRILEGLVLLPVVLIPLAVATSSDYNAIAIHEFWHLHQPPGQVLLVDGHKMHINCIGIGSPTVVLEAGLGNEALIWSQIQQSLSSTTRVCSYDRAGFGWSQAAAGPRDADHIAEELHQLLIAAHIVGPIILMGHSIAGIYMRDYTTRYPSTVAGLVFIDAMVPLAEQNPALKAWASQGPPPTVLRLAMIAGVDRLLGNCSPPPKEPHSEADKVQKEALCRLNVGAMDAEQNSLDRSGEETVHSGPYGDLPILILSEDPTRQDPAIQATWSQMQDSLRGLSTNNRRIILRGTTHAMMQQRPERISQDVSAFVDQVRSPGCSLIKNSSVVTE